MSYRRLPIYIVADRSGSMTGDPITQVSQGIRTLANNLLDDPIASEKAWMSLISFASDARQDVPLQELGTSQLVANPPELHASGQTALGAALRLLAECLKREVRIHDKIKEVQGDHRPLVFLLTDGSPTDAWIEGWNELRKVTPPPKVYAVACGAQADANVLKSFAHQVFVMRDMTAEGFKQLIEVLTITGVSELKNPSPEVAAFAPAPPSPSPAPAAAARNPSPTPDAFQPPPSIVIDPAGRPGPNAGASPIVITL